MGIRVKQAPGNSYIYTFWVHCQGSYASMKGKIVERKGAELSKSVAS
jgi:hypothetical protein